MDQTILTDLCPRCQRSETLIQVYAADVVELDARVADLESERDAYRDALRAALDQLAASTTAQRFLRDRVAALLLELRALRPSSRWAA
jgi:hypothetical protein